MKKTLADVVDLCQRTMHMLDPLLIYVVLAVAASSRLPGDPVWLGVVGPPSSGKTEILSSLSELLEHHSVSTVTVAGLLTARRTEEGVVAGGLLPLIGERGIVVISDLSTLLNQPAAQKGETFGALREVFDGKFVRRMGTNGGFTAEWEGKVTLMAATTGAIYASANDMGAAGERIVLFPMPVTTPSDDFMACSVSNENAGHQPAVRAERAAMFADFLSSLDLPSELPGITTAEEDRLITVSTVAARCRSAVMRDGYTREIELVLDPERPARIFGQLRQLHAALTVIGTPPGELWRALTQVALGGIHPGRRKVLDYLMDHPGQHHAASVAGHCRLTETPTRRHLEDMDALGVLDRMGDRPVLWKPSEWLQSAWWAITADWSKGPPDAPTVVALPLEGHGTRKVGPSSDQRQRRTEAALGRLMQATTADDLFAPIGRSS